MNIAQRQKEWNRKLREEYYWGTIHDWKEYSPYYNHHKNKYGYVCSHCRVEVSSVPQMKHALPCKPQWLPKSWNPKYNND